MKYFDIKRFGQLLRYDAVTYNRSYLKYGAAIFLCHFIMQMLVTWGMTCNMPSITASREVEVYVSNISVALAFTIMMFFIGMSLTFANLSTKAGRISYLMLPVSNLEKFISRLLIFTIGFVVVDAVALVLSDLLRALLLCQMPGHVGLAMSYLPQYCRDLMDGTTKLVNVFYHSETGVWPLIFSSAYSVFAFVFVCLMFLLGGIYFKKAAFVKTSVIMLALSFLLGWIRVSIGSFPVHENPSTLHVAISASIALVFVVAAFWLCYQTFTKVTVVSRKWF